MPRTIILCGSISEAVAIEKVRDELVALGFAVEVPEGVKNAYFRARTEVSVEEKAEDKRRGNLIKGYFDKIKAADAVLVVNVEKKGMPGHIGGNTLIEMAFAHVLNKPLYCLNALPDMPYTPELLALQPVVLNGDLGKIQ